MRTFFVTEYQSTDRDGGRDGLGLLPIWSRVARRCIWNVTSISRDLAGWRSLLVAVWLAEQVTGGADSAETRRVMLAAERLIGLARWHAPDPSVRHSDGLRGGTRIGHLEGPVRVSGDQRIVILKGQASTGVVGQIGRPAVRSGLLSEELTLDDDARGRMAGALAEVVPHLDRVRGWLLEGATIDLAAPPVLLNVLARACSRAPLGPDEAEWLLDRVVFASHGSDSDGPWTSAQQRALARGLLAVPAVDKANQSEVPKRLLPAIQQDAVGDTVRQWLDDIQAMEALLGRMDDLFAWLRGSTKQARPRTAVVDELRKAWRDAAQWTGVNSARLDHALRLVDGVVGIDDRTPFDDFAYALQKGDAGGCIQALLERNEVVVTRRDRRPWVSALGGSLRADLTSERGRLQFGTRWEHTYYLAELQSLVRDLRPALPAGGVA